MQQPGISRQWLAALLLSTTTIGGIAHADGCTKPPSAGVFDYDVGADTVVGYVPAAALGKPSPLVINLHPSGGTGWRMLSESKHVAEKNGFVMIAPTGRIGPVLRGWSWNVPGVPLSGMDKYPANDARNDVEFIDKAIDEVIASQCIDTRRIYVIGFSGGARMASTLACEMSERIASVVTIGGIRFPEASDVNLGLPDATQCSPSRKIPMQAIHGYWDPVNPWAEQKLGETPFDDPSSEGRKIKVHAPVRGSSWSYSGEEALARWVANNGCDAEPTITSLSEDIEEKTYQNCTDDAEVVLIFDHNLGHGVPGYDKPWAPGQAISTFDGYELAWDLLKDDALPK